MGLRIGEALGLSFSDFSEKGSTAYIHSSLAAVQTMDESGNWSKRTYEVRDYLKQNAEPRTIVVPKNVFSILDSIKKIQFKNKRISKLLFQADTPSVVEFKLIASVIVWELKESLRINAEKHILVN